MTKLTNLMAVAFLMASSLVASGQTLQNLKLELISSFGAFELGEPVSVQVRLTNEGGIGTPVAKFLGPDFGFVTYRIDGVMASREFAPIMLKELGQPFETLAPGDSIQQVVDLFYDSDGWNFTERGTYTVYATYMGTVEAEPLTLTIAGPEDGTAMEAAQMLINSDQAGRYMLFRGGNHLTEGREVVQRVAQMSAGRQASHAKIALGLSLLTPERDFATGTVREADPERALELLEEAEMGSIALERRVEGQQGLATALRAVGRSEDASALETGLRDALRAQFQAVEPENALERLTNPQVQQRLSSE